MTRRICWHVGYVVCDKPLMSRATQNTMGQMMKTIRKMSDTIVSVELRNSLNELGPYLTHGVEIPRRISNYIACLEKVSSDRGLTSL